MHSSEKFASEFLNATSFDPKKMPDRESISPPPPFISFANAKRIALPKVEAEKGVDVWKAMASRRSVREYRDEAISLQALSRLLWAAQGVTAGEGEVLLRTTPSAGAVYPCETYVLVRRVDGLQPGSYHLDVAERALELVRPGDVSANLARAGLGQKFLADAAVVIAWTAVSGRALARYSKRGVRYIFLDAGHISQNVALAAAALGLGCCAAGSYYDEQIADIIGIDMTREYPIYLNALGVPVGR